MTKASLRVREWRRKNPEKYAYHNLKSNSKRRGILFELSFEEFKEFCFKTEYIQGKGKTKDSYSIDRKDSSKGYTKNNIQILTLSENSRKGTKTLHYDWQAKTARVSTNLHKDEGWFDEGFEENLDF